MRVSHDLNEVKRELEIESSECDDSEMYWYYRAEIYITRLIDTLGHSPYHKAVNARIDFALHISFTLKFLFLVNMATDKSLLLGAIPTGKNPIAASYKDLAFH